MFEGNVEQLSDLDEFVGWGQNPYFSEFDERGRTVLDGRFVSDTASYRAYRFLWSATGVSSWRVLEGNRLTALRPVKTAAKTSFETVIDVPRAPQRRGRAARSAGHQLKPAPALNTGA